MERKQSRLYREGQTNIPVEIIEDQILKDFKKYRGKKKALRLIKILNIILAIVTLILIGLMSCYLYIPVNTTLLFVVGSVTLGLCIVNEILRIVSNRRER